MRVIVLGGGGREHALCWSIRRDPGVERVIAAPGNPGIAADSRCESIDPTNVDEVIALARREQADLVVVGPEAPLVAGVADALRLEGFAAFGPGREGASLESSKAVAKAFMRRHGIPTAEGLVFDEAEALRQHLERCPLPTVVKADGLAAGKGVFVCHSREDARAAGRAMDTDGRFGAASQCVLVERFLPGEEATLLVLRDESGVVPLPPLQDHKRRFDGDQGPNTGGMGAYTPVPAMDAGMCQRVMDEIVLPTHRGLLADGIAYRGVLYVGLMIGPDGPKVVEYNARFGDPECQALVVALGSSMLPWLWAVARGEVGTMDPPAVAVDTTLCVALVDEAYPERGEPGGRVTGADEVERDGTWLFHAGTSRAPDGGLLAGGGRVFSVVARGACVATARTAALARIGGVRWPRLAYRADIGHRAEAG